MNVSRSQCVTRIYLDYSYRWALEITSHEITGSELWVCPVANHQQKWYTPNIVPNICFKKSTPCLCLIWLWRWIIFPQNVNRLLGFFKNLAANSLPHGNAKTIFPRNHRIPGYIFVSLCCDSSAAVNHSIDRAGEVLNNNSGILFLIWMPALQWGFQDHSCSLFLAFRVLPSAVCRPPTVQWFIARTLYQKRKSED